MNITKTYFIVLFLCTLLLCQSQSRVVVAGGLAKSAVCSMSYSVGQIDYVPANIDNSVIMNLGMQQAYFIGPILPPKPKLGDFVPNAFTPTANDGNATWDLSKTYLPENSTIKVFNRHGILVYEATGKQAKDTAWDGGNLPASAYWYVINRNDGSKELTGSITILK